MAHFFLTYLPAGIVYPGAFIFVADAEFACMAIAGGSPMLLSGTQLNTADLHEKSASSFDKALQLSYNFKPGPIMLSSAGVAYHFDSRII